MRLPLPALPGLSFSLSLRFSCSSLQPASNTARSRAAASGSGSRHAGPGLRPQRLG